MQASPAAHRWHDGIAAPFEQTEGG